jgi:hypothetical protein
MEINNNQQLSKIFEILDKLTLLESTLDLNFMMIKSYKSTMTKQKEKLIFSKKTDLKLHSELEDNLLLCYEFEKNCKKISLILNECLIKNRSLLLNDFNQSCERINLTLKDCDLELKLMRNEFDKFKTFVENNKLILKDCNSSWDKITSEKTTTFLDLKNPNNQHLNNQQFKKIYPIDFSWKKKLCKSMLVLTGYLIGATVMGAGVVLKMTDVLNQQDGLAVSIAGLCLVVVLTVGIALNYLHNIDKKLDQNNNISSTILYNQTNILDIGI